MYSPMTSLLNDLMAGKDDDLPFRIELWDDHDRHIEEVIALVSDYATARSAFDEAVRRGRAN